MLGLRVLPQHLVTLLFQDHFLNCGALLWQCTFVVRFPKGLISSYTRKKKGTCVFLVGKFVFVLFWTVFTSENIDISYILPLPSVKVREN